MHRELRYCKTDHPLGGIAVDPLLIQYFFADGDWLQVRRKRSARRAKAARSEMSVEDSILSGGPLLSAEELEDMCTCPITCVSSLQYK